jgi:hypothetical protein
VAGAAVAAGGWVGAAWVGAGGWVGAGAWVAGAQADDRISMAAKKQINPKRNFVNIGLLRTNQWEWMGNLYKWFIGSWAEFIFNLLENSGGDVFNLWLMKERTKLALRF